METSFTSFGSSAAETVTFEKTEHSARAFLTNSRSFVCMFVCVCVRACVCFRLKINYLSVDIVQLCSLTTECPSSSSTQSLRIYYMEQFRVMYLNMTYIHTHIHTSAHISYIDGVHNRCWRCPPSSCWHNSTRLFIFHETRLKTVGLIQFTACEIAFLGSFSVRALSV
jgi:hypothetical protein